MVLFSRESLGLSQPEIAVQGPRIWQLRTSTTTFKAKAAPQAQPISNSGRAILVAIVPFLGIRVIIDL
jgi:hypothetical protein